MEPKTKQAPEVIVREIRRQTRRKLSSRTRFGSFWKASKGKNKQGIIFHTGVKKDVFNQVQNNSKLNPRTSPGLGKLHQRNPTQCRVRLAPEAPSPRLSILRSGKVEAIRVHHLCPSCHEVMNELLL